MQKQNIQLLIYTQNPSFFGFFSRVRASIMRAAKTALFALWRTPRFLPYGGPDAVATSLLRGLAAHGIFYSLNKNVSADIVSVLASPAALRFAIEGKGQGRFKKIIAGPNIVHNPTSEQELIRHPAIDAIIVPSEWNKDWWLSIAPELAPRIHAWPAGVSKNIPTSSKTGRVVVYLKNQCPFLDTIVSQVSRVGLTPRIMRYGTFTHKEFLHELSDARVVIYLSHSESQGIALSEAWMADVPTLVWNPGFFDINGYSWKDSKMSAPYATAETGEFFASEAEFVTALAKYMGNPAQYSPRAYCAQHLSDEASASRYLTIAGLR